MSVSGSKNTCNYSLASNVVLEDQTAMVQDIIAVGKKKRMPEMHDNYGNWYYNGALLSKELLRRIWGRRARGNPTNPYDPHFNNAYKLKDEFL